MWHKLGIKLPVQKGQGKTRCPNCKKLGKENWKDTCLSINVEEGIYNCHKCGWSGSVNTKVYDKPTRKNLTKLSDDGLAEFTKRGITQKVVLANKIAEDNGWVVFPYLKGGELVNLKKRKIGEKDFRQYKNAEPILFNYDRAEGDLIITEGEIDAMSFEQAGKVALSVNQGAPNANAQNVDKDLACITNCYSLFDQAENVYIAVDNDDSGVRLEKELIRRIGAEKCRIVDFSPFKDANEVLVQEGKESLLERLKTAKNVKLDGVFTAHDVKDSMLSTFRIGKKRGETTHFPSLDKRFTWRMGEVNVWTGYNNEGKTQFLNQLAVLKSVYDGWKWGVFSPENFPADEYFDDLIHTYIGKSTDIHFDNVMSEEEYIKGVEFVNEHFFYIYPDENFKLATLHEKLKYLVKTEGINGVIIDPYNQIEHYAGNNREDLYISRFMGQLKRFALENDISYNLVAHQVTPQKEDGRYPKPSLYRIKGGGTFSDKADNVLIVYRPNRAIDPTDTLVEFHSDKIKKQRLTGIPGMVEMDFSRSTNRYYVDDLNPMQQETKEQIDFSSKEEESPF